MKTNVLSIILITALMLISTLLLSQVAINTDGSTPDNSAMLDVKSTIKGFLPPRMNSSQIAAIQSPANGLMVYNTGDRHMYVFNTADNAWKRLAYDQETIVSGCENPLIDPRDGKSYPTVSIGNQCWMAENLNFSDQFSACYYSDPTNCLTYGRLYSPPEIQGSCPDGWHIPTDEDWDILKTFLGNNAGGKMKTTGTIEDNTGLWYTPNSGATNESGFSALPGGTDGVAGGGNLGYSANFWSSSKSLEHYVPYFIYTYCHWVSLSNSSVTINDESTRFLGSVTCSERCIKNDRPLVVTYDISAVQNSVTANGEVISQGISAVTAKGFCWNLIQDGDPTISNQHTDEGTGTGVFTSNITGLLSNTYYIIRAYATNSFGTMYDYPRIILTL